MPYANSLYASARKFSPTASRKLPNGGNAGSPEPQPSGLCYRISPGRSTNSEQNGEFTLIEHLSSNVKTFIDVGADIGAWSECMLKHASCNDFRFEPSGQCVKVLKGRLRERNVVIRDVAVWDQIGTAQFAKERNC
jgi:hypothetical protein